MIPGEVMNNLKSVATLVSDKQYVHYTHNNFVPSIFYLSYHSINPFSINFRYIDF